MFSNLVVARCRWLLGSVRHRQVAALIFVIMFSLAVETQWAPPRAHAASAVKGNTRWAIVLCKFSDVSAEPQPPGFFRDLFTETGAGQGGMFDYWQSMSYGSISLTGSQVGGWYTMPVSLSTAKNWSWPAARSDLMKACIDAGNKDFYYPDYYGIIAILNATIDSGSVGNGDVSLYLDGQTKTYALTNLDPGAWNATFAAHEMGHGYGLEDSFDSWHTKTCDTWGGPGAYCDSWDIMSAVTFGNLDPTFTGAHFGSSGPGLNAASRNMLGWIPSGRIWPYAPYTHIVQLAGLEVPAASGYLLAPVWIGLGYNSYAVEFRRRIFWDRHIPSFDAVLVRRVDGSRTYLERGNKGAAGLLAGDYFASAATNVMIGVLDIDTVNSVATVKIGPYPNLVTTRSAITPPANAAGWSNADTQVTLTAFASSAGVQAISYAANGAQRIPPTEIHARSRSFTISNEGETTVVYSATDNDGTSDFMRKLVLKLDKKPPKTIAAVIDGANPGEHIVTLSAMDEPNGSGVKLVDYSASQPVTVLNQTNTSLQIKIAASGETDLHYWSIDNADNFEGPNFIQFKPIALLTPTDLTFSSPVGVVSAPQSVTLKNDGQTTLAIGRITTNGYAFQAQSSSSKPCGTSLAPGAECQIDVVFGPYTASTYVDTLYVETNTSPRPTVALMGMGTMPAIEFTPPALSFPTTFGRDVSQPQTATIRNTGQAPLLITDISTGIGAGTDFPIYQDNCTPKPKTLQPGDTCTIQVVFKPQRVGILTGGLMVTDNAPGGRQTMPLQGISVATPVLSFSPSSLNFASQSVNSTGAPLTVVLTNTGTANLHISSVNLSGVNAADFSVARGSCQPQPGATDLVVPPEQTCDLAVQFTPSALGNRSGDLLIASNMPNNAQQLVPLNGIGIATPAVSLNPTSLLFANWPVNSVNSSSAQAITLTNNSPSPLIIQSVGITGTHLNDFAIVAGSDACGGTNVIVGGMCTVKVAFTPRAVGDRNAHLVFMDSPGNIYTVALAGTGVGAIVSFEPPSLSFNPLRVGAFSQAQEVTLRNVGNAILTVSDVSITGDFQQSPRCSAAVPPGGFCTIRVIFRPSTVGRRGGQVIVSSNAIGSPHAVVLIGMGR
jgi:M6 family metalloprotease-like protein